MTCMAGFKRPLGLVETLQLGQRQSPIEFQIGRFEG